MINFFLKISIVLSQKRQFFRKVFRRKYLKNHNIDPRSSLTPKNRAAIHAAMQGCQMVYFHAKNRNMGMLLGTWEWKMLVYFTVIWNTLHTTISYVL
jgi:hypothetical protein